MILDFRILDFRFEKIEILFDVPRKCFLRNNLQINFY